MTDQEKLQKCTDLLNKILAEFRERDGPFDDPLRRAIRETLADVTPPPDLATLFDRLEHMTPDVEEHWWAERQEDQEHYGLWLGLECVGPVEWHCGYRYQPDEAAEWAYVATGNNPTHAAQELLKQMEEA